MKLELHCHTTASDGRLSPDDLMDLVIAEGLDLIAVTDHDTTASLPRIRERAAMAGIRFIPGIELTTIRNEESIHILGYFTDESYEDQELIDYLKNLFEHRNDRVMKMIRLLKIHFDINLDYASVRDRAGGVLTRVHVAKAIQRQYPGYTVNDIFDRFISKDSPAYVPNRYLSVEDGLALLKRYGAVSVLAHPVIYRKNTLEDLLTYDFDGLECYYPQNDAALTKKCLRLAKEKDLLVTAGSDYHGIKDDLKHGYLSSITYDPDHLQPFLERFL